MFFIICLFACVFGAIYGTIVSKYTVFLYKKEVDNIAATKDDWTEEEAEEIVKSLDRKYRLIRLVAWFVFAIGWTCVLIKIL